ncbi:MAG: hypothetical protein JXN59_07375 [Anaerolineae bacterium]|nr:hypothetical protein [Anaerolineae bacterium]
MPPTKREHYQAALQALTPPDWEAFLLAESGLPGPRANLELAQAAADAGSAGQFRRWLVDNGPLAAALNTSREFLAFCGTVGLGRLLAEGQSDVLPLLRQAANDPRWRIREATAMALERWAKTDLPAVLAALDTWAAGTCLERRAAAAGLCDPGLLADREAAAAALALLDRITASILAEPERRQADFLALRKGLAYCWSVAVAADPERGKPLMATWCANPDPDIRWIMRENLRKARLVRADPDWCAAMQAQVQADSRAKHTPRTG